MGIAFSKSARVKFCVRKYDEPAYRSSREQIAGECESVGCCKKAETDTSASMEKR